jgi:hypothetical protein
MPCSKSRESGRMKPPSASLGWQTTTSTRCNAPHRGKVQRVVGRGIPLAFVIGSMLFGGPAVAAPTRVTPPKKTRKERRAEREQRDFSEGGQRRGILELTLGGLTATMSAILIGRGAWEIARASTLADACRSPSPPLECDLGDPARHNYVAGGLSFGFAVPFAVASGFLFAYGVRIHRDHREHQARAKLTIAPWGSPGSGGMQLRLRF